jgi:glycosyltransferase involved in cell wall biosynthesis
VVGEDGERPTVRILGIRGVPANHGGFETAAEAIAVFLVDRGWRVVVYCQSEHEGPTFEDEWKGIERVHISAPDTGPASTMRFDWIAVRHAVRHRDLCLTFGYNTAILNVLQRVKGIPQVINMDGIEWSRPRWKRRERAFLYLNERIACRVGNSLIADHPAIAEHLRTRAPSGKITMIPYGAHAITDAPTSPLEDYGLEPGQYLTLIARPLQDNSVLELVRGFSARARGRRLAVLGSYSRHVPYHREVMAAASDEVDFLGAVYDADVVAALRFHGTGYLHGHTVGGTNPSLVEALAAANPVIAHDNEYNRWVAGPAARYFRSADDVDRQLTTLLENPSLNEEMSRLALLQWHERFRWGRICEQYEQLLTATASGV